MSFADDIAEKRKQQQVDARSSSLHSESVDAVKGSGEDIVAALLGTNEGPKDVKVLNTDLAKKDDIDKIIQELKQIHLTNLLEANKPKPPAPVEQPRAMNITDSAAYVGDAIEKLSKEVMAKLDDTTEDAAMQKSLTDLKDSLATLQKDMKSGTAFSKLQKSIDNLEVNPIVNVAAPKVTVQSAPVDLKPLQATLEKCMANDDDDGIDLDDFRAQDIDNTNPDMQYVGFIHPNGNWYIIENDIKGNRLRYVFGASDYSKAFASASMYTYMLLNEAIDALSA